MILNCNTTKLLKKLDNYQQPLQAFLLLGCWGIDSLQGIIYGTGTLWGWSMKILDICL